jgi:hypothetical protein
VWEVAVSPAPIAFVPKSSQQILAILLVRYRTIVEEVCRAVHVQQIHHHLLLVLAGVVVAAVTVILEIRQRNVVHVLAVVVGILEGALLLLVTLRLQVHHYFHHQPTTPQ